MSKGLHNLANTLHAQLHTLYLYVQNVHNSREYSNDLSPSVLMNSQVII